MKNIITLLSGLLIVASLSSCEETIQLDLDQATQAVIIEGMITNETGKHYVKISQAAGFYQSGATARITNALVRLTVDTGEQVPFIHNPSGDTKLEGFYFPSPTFMGEIGRSYKLRVEIGSRVYEAQDRLPAITPIDSLSYQINEEEQEDPDEDHPDRIYEALLFVKEPQETKDYYLFKFYRNDTITYANNTDVYVANDEGLGESIDGFPTPVYFSKGERATIEMYSLSRDAYLFYNDLAILMNGDGGMFSPPPANPRTGWSNGALGFFQASAVRRSTITIEK